MADICDRLAGAVTDVIGGETVARETIAGYLKDYRVGATPVLVCA